MGTKSHLWIFVERSQKGHACVIMSFVHDKTKSTDKRLKVCIKNNRHICEGFYAKIERKNNRHICERERHSAVQHPVSLPGETLFFFSKKRKEIDLLIDLHLKRSWKGRSILHPVSTDEATWAHCTVFVLIFVFVFMFVYIFVFVFVFAQCLHTRPPELTALWKTKPLSRHNFLVSSIYRCTYVYFCFVWKLT